MTVSYCLGAALQRLSRIPCTQHDAEIAQLPETCSHADCTTGMGCRAYIASMLAQELRRRECEARGWLRRGYTRKVKVEALMEKIAAQRGQAAAEALRQDMREQWARRVEWLEPAE